MNTKEEIDTLGCLEQFIFNYVIEVKTEPSMISRGPKTGLVPVSSEWVGRYKRSNLPEGYSIRKCPEREPEGLWL